MSIRKAESLDSVRAGRRLRVISSGQTGIDRGALDAALEAGFTVGGWCPWGRMADDGRVYKRYLSHDLTASSQSVRIRRNVEDSDGTLIIYFGTPSTGTRATLAACLSLDTPFLLVDASEIPPIRAARRLSEFVDQHGINVLNVAGPRASEEPRGYNYARDVLNGYMYRAAGMVVG